MEIIKEKAVCFTGHRPETFCQTIGLDGPAIKMIKSMLYYQIQLAIDDGYEYFISGVARGVDIWAANYVIELKRKYPRLKLICAKPFLEHSKGFRGSELYDLNNILKKSDDVVCVSEHYSRGCYMRRNRFMVDNASRLIAVVGNYQSGTGQTINYAYKQGIDIRTINVKDYI